MLAELFSKRADKSVLCGLCAHCCVVVEGKKGKCAVRANIDGELHTLVGDRVAAVNIDPIEKKPLYHFMPGTTTFSFGTVGCNFACDFCQNHDISRLPAETGHIAGQATSPAALVSAARSRGAASISFTYNEPTVFFELMRATALEAADMPCVLVSNGFMSAEALAALPQNIVAANIDLKAFNDNFYKKYCHARLNPVLDNLKTMVRAGNWVEVTTLLIPGLNDDPAELADLASFIRKELGPGVPWHISRFHGAYKMAHHPATSAESIERAYKIGLAAGLNYVYIGNAGWENTTFCPACGEPFATRQGFSVKLLSPDGKCPSCGNEIEGKWK